MMKKKDMIKELRKLGFEKQRSKKHLVLKHPEVNHTIILPNQNEINRMLSQRVLKEARDVVAGKRVINTYTNSQLAATS